MQFLIDFDCQFPPEHDWDSFEYQLGCFCYGDLATLNFLKFLEMQTDIIQIYNSLWTLDWMFTSVNQKSKYRMKYIFQYLFCKNQEEIHKLYIYIYIYIKSVYLC